MLLLAACTLFSPPRFHLWGDGALRLRNLEAGFPVFAAAPLEFGDYGIRLLMTGAGIAPADTYRITGVAGGALYLWGLLMMVGSRRRDRYAAAKLALGTSPAWMIFFTGYVESYALAAGLFAVYTGLALKGAGALSLAVTSLMASASHLVGLGLVPGAGLQALRESDRARKYGALALLAGTSALVLLPVLLEGPGRIPDMVQVPRIPGRLSLLVFAVPVLPALVTPGAGRPGASLLTGAVIFTGALVFFPLERGPAIDWDLGALFLVIPFLLLLHRTSGRFLQWAAAAAILLAGPRVGMFLDPEASETMYRRVLEDCRDPAALEEMAILLRDRGELSEASRLLEKAFRLSGNGRHLAMLSEVYRMEGLADKALASAGRAVELRPDLETGWLQLAFAARDAGDPAAAFLAAEGHETSFPEHEGPGLWPVSLETAVNAGHGELAWRSALPLLEGPGDDPALLINLAGASYLTGRLELAGSFLEEAARLAPDNPLILFNRGLVALEMSDSSSAEGYLIEVLRLEPGMEGAALLLEEIRGRR